ncbi:MULTISPECIES: hypothetical protein [unclassified Bradyrhizobium]|uniref:hypothetical protein n=1 Tax=unclassified Bradyrhizobium TaxID=2631580 RepID=UPI00155E0A89|nr:MULTISPECIES: hypothetical protein [unclassified Bradyrhizobium]UUO29363.1 hypothetical protein DCG74_19730 [Bradyrhizobium sp. WBAH42]
MMRTNIGQLLSFSAFSAELVWQTKCFAENAPRNPTPAEVDFRPRKYSYPLSRGSLYQRTALAIAALAEKPSHRADATYCEADISTFKREDRFEK